MEREPLVHEQLGAVVRQAARHSTKEAVPRFYTDKRYIQGLSRGQQAVSGLVGAYCGHSDPHLQSDGLPQTMEYVSIDGLDWDLATATKELLQRDVRKEAFRKATIKAEDYASAYSAASAMNSENLRCKQVEDFADRHGISDGGGPVQPMMFRAAKVGGGGDGEAVDLKPKEVEITAGVSCVFEYSV